MKVLIVDDSTYMRGTIRATLEAHQFEVVGEAGSGESAIDLMVALQPDVVTLDNMLPDMTGIEIMQACRQHQIATQFIMISALGQESTVQEALKLGATHYLVKPFDHTKLIEILKDFSK